MLMNRSEIIGREIRAGTSRLMLKQVEVATRIHMSPATYERRLKDPGTFKLDELLKLEKELKIELLNPKLKN